MFPTDPLNDVISAVDDLNEEDGRLITGYGPKTWGIDFENGRLYKATERDTPFERAVKYLVTPRGQVPIYPDNGETFDFDTGYGSLSWTLIGDQFEDDEDAMRAVQSICDEATERLDDIDSIVCSEAHVLGDRLTAWIVITTIEQEVQTRGLEFST